MEGCYIYENAVTECDSSDELERDFALCKTNPLKHKTYSEIGFCNYGDKCRFAHGTHELIRLPKDLSFKRRDCKGFWGKGQCNYGIRCKFGHCKSDPEEKIILTLAKVCFNAEDARPRLSGLRQILQLE